MRDVGAIARAVQGVFGMLLFVPSLTIPSEIPGLYYSLGVDQFTKCLQAGLIDDCRRLDCKADGGALPAYSSTVSGIWDPGSRIEKLEVHISKLLGGYGMEELEARTSTIQDAGWKSSRCIPLRGSRIEVRTSLLLRIELKNVIYKGYRREGVICSYQKCKRILDMARLSITKTARISVYFTSLTRAVEDFWCQPKPYSMSDRIESDRTKPELNQPEQDKTRLRKQQCFCYPSNSEFNHTYRKPLYHEIHLHLHRNRTPQMTRNPVALHT